MKRIPNILSIAGSDPSGACGSPADIKTISANGGYAMAVLTSLTVQNSLGISGLHMSPARFVAAQIEFLLADVQVDAVKIGMLGESPVIEAVAETLEGLECPIVLDPVMSSSTGNPLLARNAVSALCEILIPLVTVVTPNLPEAAVLLKTDEAGDRDEMEMQAEALLELGAKAVLLKGGHFPGPTSPDLLMTAEGPRWFESIRVETTHSRGTGCTLSSALATHLALTGNMETSVGKAKDYLFQSLTDKSGLHVGQGRGPLDHFGVLWQNKCS